MQTLTVQITNDNALKTLYALEEKQFINILDEFASNSPALPGTSLNINAFKNWIANAENTATVDAKKAKLKWASKRKQLEKLIK